MTSLPPELNMLVSLLLAALFGGLIGLEREFHHHPAGLRTNMLVCIGACMFSLIAIQGFSTADQSSRIIANVLVGIGFLGAGAVLKEQATVHALAGAATIWIVAAMGVALALKLYPLAISAEVIVLITLFVLGQIEQRIAPLPPTSEPRATDSTKR